MEFQINIQTDFELQAEQFLHEQLEKGYSQTTVNGYRSYLNRMKKYIRTRSELMCTDKTACEFMKHVVPALPVSASSKKHIRTSIRRFNDYLSGSSYVFRKNRGAQMPPVIFQEIVSDDITDMTEQGYKPATVETRKIFAIQFLTSVYKQGMQDLKIRFITSICFLKIY